MMLELENMLIIIATIRLNSYHVILVRNSSTTKAFRFSSKSYYYAKLLNQRFDLRSFFEIRKRNQTHFYGGVIGSCMKRLKENIPYGDTISTKHKNDHKAVLQKNYLHCVSIVVVLRARQTTKD